MKKFYLSIFLLYTINSIYSQNIKITLIDSISSEPIPYTIITFENKAGTYSNSNGEFTILGNEGIIEIVHIGYIMKVIKTPSKDTILKLQPKIYQLQEIVINQQASKTNFGFNNRKTELTYSGLSGDEIAVYIPNETGNYSRIRDAIIIFDTRKIIKKDLEINFTSVFKLNFYSVKDNAIEPGLCILKKDIILTSKDIKKKSTIDISQYDIIIPKNGIFASIEWVGILSNVGELKTDYRDRTEPFLSTTFEKTNTKIFIRNKFKGLKWELLDKNNSYSQLLKKDNFFTPCIGFSN